MNQEPLKDHYRSVSAPSKGTYKDKGSRFLAFSFPVESESDVKKHLSQIKKEYYDARHHCYAYRIGYDGASWRINDDGEPSSTAGKPIYGQILSHQLSDILIVVVRYFGGIKLGVPGLIKAYKSAAQDAIANASIIEKIATLSYCIDFEYERTSMVMKLLKDANLTPSRQKFDTNCRIEVKVPLSETDNFKTNLYNNKLNYYAEESYFDSGLHPQGDTSHP